VLIKCLFRKKCVGVSNPFFKGDSTVFQTHHGLKIKSIVKTNIFLPVLTQV